MIELYFIWWTVACFTYGALVSFIMIDDLNDTNILEKDKFYINLFLYSPLSSFLWPVSFTLVYIQFLLKRK